MLRRLSVGLLASALAIAPLPTKAQDGTAEDLGDVMSISLKDVVKTTIGFQGALQVLVLRTKQALVGSFLWLLVRTAFGSLMPWSMPTSATEMATAASSTPMSLVDSQRQLVWATAG